MARDGYVVHVEVDPMRHETFCIDPICMDETGKPVNLGWYIHKEMAELVVRVHRREHRMSRGEQFEVCCPSCDHVFDPLAEVDK